MCIRRFASRVSLPAAVAPILALALVLSAWLGGWGQEKNPESRKSREERKGAADNTKVMDVIADQVFLARSRLVRAEEKFREVQAELGEGRRVLQEALERLERL